VVAEEGAQGLVVVAELELGEVAEGGRRARQALVVGGHLVVKVLVECPNGTLIGSTASLVSMGV
jgi:hypothetical protein